LTKKALRIAFDAHKDQVDKDGLPYIHHPIHLAEQMDTEEKIVVALLHDVVEDTDLTFEVLESEGFPQTIISALKLLTHDDDSDYCEYVHRIKSNPLAACVKLADLQHNSDSGRLASLPPETADRLSKKYAEAIRILKTASM